MNWFSLADKVCMWSESVDIKILGLLYKIVKQSQNADTEDQLWPGLGNTPDHRALTGGGLLTGCWW